MEDHAQVKERVRRDWDENSAHWWLKEDVGAAAGLQPVSRAMLDLARIESGMRVLDVCCGAGEVALEIGRIVGPEGSSVGVDLSHVMIGGANERRDRVGASNVHYQVMDGENLQFEDGR